MSPDPVIGRTGFAAVRAALDGVEGWLTDAQAQRLWERARALGTGARIVEIGSFRGRSTIVLALAAAPGVEVVAIDPHAGGDRGPREITSVAERGHADHTTFLANLAAAGVTERVRHVRAFSHEALVRVAGPVDLLFIDGAHRYGPARDDIRDWGARVRGSGTMLVHDAFCSIGVTAAIVRHLLFGREFRYIGRVGSLAEYRKERVTRAARRANACRQLRELPYFVRGVLVKVLITLRLRPLTRLLGNTQEWPY